MNFDFGREAQSWGGGCSDFSEATAPVDVLTTPSSLPQPLAGTGLRLSGTNRSDDLFIFVKRQVAGLQAGRSYDLSFSLQFGTRTPRGCPGVGGSPGDSVWVCAGASPLEPFSIKDGSGFYRVNWDRGNQSTGGAHAAVLGTLASSRSDCSPASWVWESKSVSQSTPLRVTADGAGRLWFLFGIDSGFESYSEVYLLSATATLVPRNP